MIYMIKGTLSSCESIMLWPDPVSVTPQIKSASLALNRNGLSPSCYWSCEECDLCPVQGFNWFGVVMWNAIKLSYLPIGGSSDSEFPGESVDEGVVLCIGHSTGFMNE